MDNYETYRTRLLSQFSTFLSAEQLHKAIEALDTVSNDYEISHKPVEIIPVEEVPAVMKLFLASKALENTSQATLQNYGMHLKNLFAFVRKPITNIVTNDIRAYLYDYKATRKVNDQTLDTMRRVFNSFFQWCVDNEYLLRNPVARIPKIKYQPTEKKILRPYDLEFFRFSCTDIREKALVDFLFSTGCRVSECSAVNKDDIDWNSRAVTIQHGKGNKRRIVYLNAEAVVSVQAYLASRKDEDPSLFVSTRAPFSRLSKRGIEREIEKIKERASISWKCTPHTLRRTFATYGLASGMPLEQVQSLMGHSKPETTMIYADIDQSDLRNAHAKAFS